MSGRKTNDFTLGNNFWLGTMEGCRQLNNPPRITLQQSKTRKMLPNVTSIQSEVPLVYRIFRVEHQSPLQFDFGLFKQSVIHIGLCFPKFCGSDDAEIIGRNILVPITFEDHNLYGNVSFMTSKVLSIREDFLNETFVQILM